MKRALKSLLLAGMVAGALAMPMAPASAANTCTGIAIDENGNQVGSWPCSECPPLTYGPLDGRFHVIICFDPA